LGSDVCSSVLFFFFFFECIQCLCILSKKMLNKRRTNSQLFEIVSYLNNITQTNLTDIVDNILIVLEEQWV